MSNLEIEKTYLKLKDRVYDRHAEMKLEISVTGKSSVSHTRSTTLS